MFHARSVQIRRSFAGLGIGKYKVGQMDVSQVCDKNASLVPAAVWYLT